MKLPIAILFTICCFSYGYSQTIEERLEELSIELPEPSTPIANYVKAVTVGNLVFLAGHGPATINGVSLKGKVGKDLSINQGYEASRLTALALLSTLKNEIGDLDRVVRIVKVTGMVNCIDTFTAHPQVIKGGSDRLGEIFGEKGKHARAAVGMNSLPSNIPVEIEMIVEIR